MFGHFKKKKAEQEKARRKRIKQSLLTLTKSKRQKWEFENRIKTRWSVRKCRVKKKNNGKPMENVGYDSPKEFNLVFRLHPLIIPIRRRVRWQKRLPKPLERCHRRQVKKSRGIESMEIAK